MAGVSTKEIKNRIRSMQSTRQITKAMEMVAASKLRKAQEQVLSSRPYFEMLYATMNDIVDSTRDFSSPYLGQRKGNKTLHIVIAGDRGLAGGYNSNVLKLAMSEMVEQDVTTLPIGKKASEFFKYKEIASLDMNYADAASITLGDCFSIAKAVCKLFQSGDFDQVYMSYTNFVTVLSQEPACIRLLPLLRTKTERAGKMQSDVVYEPDEATVFDAIVPEYLGGVLYGALCESRASEQAARRTAMDSATKNADEMIDDLSLRFNRARQAAITQEITEIVAGSQ